MMMKGTRLSKLTKGDKFHRLVVVGFKELRKGKQFYTFLCDCGKITVKCMGNVKSGNAKSCGCLRSEMLSKRAKTHGESGSRLHQCWKSMRRRSRGRKDCEISQGWSSFEIFKSWALENGYKDDLVLCRNGDVGNYEPENVRWDTKSGNSREHTVCRWEVVTPEGITEEVEDMVKYCEDRGLCAWLMRGISRGKTKRHKGYTNVRKLT